MVNYEPNSYIHWSLQEDLAPFIEPHRIDFEPLFMNVLATEVFQGEAFFYTGDKSWYSLDESGDVTIPISYILADRMRDYAKKRVIGGQND